MHNKVLVKTLTAILMIVCVVPPIYFGGMALHILIGVICGLAAYEMACLTDQKPHPVQTVMNFVALEMIVECQEDAVLAIAGGWLIVLFVKELINDRVNSDFVAYTFLITMLLGIALRVILHFYDFEDFYSHLFTGQVTSVEECTRLGFLLLLFCALGAFVTDTGAYFCGITLGKHKMSPRISPNKTWEGSIGGYLFGSVISCIFGLFFLKELPVTWIVATAFTMPIVSQVGDLAFSSLKRRHGIKDFGNEFPGHGGILDRVDSLVFVLLLVHLTMRIWGL